MATRRSAPRVRDPRGRRRLAAKPIRFRSSRFFWPSADIEVVGVVDHRLGAQGATLLVVLLDARVLVVDVQRRDHPVGDYAGSIP